MYQFRNPLPEIFTIYFDKTYIGQILIKDGYIIDLVLYDCSYSDFMKDLLFELGVDQIFAKVKKSHVDYYNDLGFVLVNKKKGIWEMIYSRK